MQQGIITNIQRFSIHDGPGIRTTVFLKGCNLHCFWCHNPEDIRLEPELQFFPERCIACEACLEACKQGAHLFAAGGELPANLSGGVIGERVADTDMLHAFMRDRCNGCGDCVDTCYAQGLVLVGNTMSVEQVMAEITQDQPFYASSGGGVTLSGGEPLLQVEFARELLVACQAAGIHTAIETAANVAWSRLASLLPVLDLVMMDIKQMDSAVHQQVTGAPNTRILENAKRLGEQPQPLIVRTPIVPGVNDTVEQVAAIAGFVAHLPNLLYYELLPFHPMAKSKYRSLDLAYGAEELTAPPAAQMAELADAAKRQGVTVRVG
jgi:pyruvate formate lyase activating enzyme